MKALAEPFRAHSLFGFPGLPLLLAAMTVANLVAFVHFQGRDHLDTQNRISRHASDSLIETTRWSQGSFDHEFTQYFAFQEILAGATLVAPQPLRLRRSSWRMLALVDVIQAQQRPIGDFVEAQLRRETRVRLRFRGRRIDLVGDLRPPFDAPLFLLLAPESGGLYVVSQNRLVQLPSLVPPIGR